MKTAGGAARSDYLPDFCTSRTTLAVVLMLELTAFLLTLARQSPAVDFWTDLARTSLFLLWAWTRRSRPVVRAAPLAGAAPRYEAYSTAVLRPPLIAVLVAVISLLRVLDRAQPESSGCRFHRPVAVPPDGAGQLRGAQRVRSD